MKRRGGKPQVCSAVLFLGQSCRAGRRVFSSHGQRARTFCLTQLTLCASAGYHDLQFVLPDVRISVDERNASVTDVAPGSFDRNARQACRSGWRDARTEPVTVMRLALAEWKDTRPSVHHTTRMLTGTGTTCHGGGHPCWRAERSATTPRVSNRAAFCLGPVLCR